MRRRPTLTAESTSSSNSQEHIAQIVAGTAYARLIPEPNPSSYSRDTHRRTDYKIHAQNGNAKALRGRPRIGLCSEGKVMPICATVDEYIASFPPEVGRVLEEVRTAIRAVLPGTEERISYGIPTFALDGRYVVYFSGWKRHVSVYPIPAADPELARAIKPFRAGKGTLKFALDQPMPTTLIQRVAARLLEQRIARSD